MSLTREDLAKRCASTSFDKLTMDYENKKVMYTHSFRDAEGTVLEEFITEVHFSVLQPRPLTQPEERALLAFGLCHCTYVFLVSAKRAPLLQVRAGYFSPEELQFFRPALAGALAEYFYLADLDLADFRIDCCCDPPHPITDKQATAPVAVVAAAAQAAGPQVSEPYAQAAAAAAAEKDDVPSGSASLDEAEAAGTSSAHSRNEPPQQKHLPRNHAPRVLVPFGGGKDSTLLMELLGTLGAEVGWVYFGEWVGSWEVYSKFTRLAEASPAGTVVLAEQNLPCLERLKELNLVPELPFQDYSAYVSFYTFGSAFVALQEGYDYICVGNEYSANAINTTHPKYNYPVNHQYEKSFEAERAFHAYLRDHVHPRLYYFSGLQHMTELEIAQRFAAICAAKYLDLIISCNWAMDDDWCGGCEKCAFVFLLFAAFLPVSDIMAKVFGVPAGSAADGPADTSSRIVPGSRESLVGVYDMYDSERHVPVFESLMGLSGHKPFECVGTPEEVLAAMYLALQRYRAGASGITPRLRAGEALESLDRGAEALGPTAEAASAAVPEPPASAAAGAAVESSDKEAEVEAEQEAPQHENGRQMEELRGREGKGAPAAEGGQVGGALPLLLRKHAGLISSKGREEWDKIRESIRVVAETGVADVPTLYPDWFRRGMKESAVKG